MPDINFKVINSMTKLRRCLKLSQIAVGSLILFAAVGSVVLAAGETETSGITIFAFDDFTIAFKDNLLLTMVSAQKHPSNPVLPRGAAGSVDAQRAQFFGSVIRVAGKFRMWYAAGEQFIYNETKERDTLGYRVAYAESDDGINWVKPNLGLVSFGGNKNNNLVSMPEVNLKFTVPVAVFVLYEPEEKDPACRYKMITLGYYYASSDVERKRAQTMTFYPLFSADGLNWKSAVTLAKDGVLTDKEAPIRLDLELGGLYKFDDIYYVAGQGGYKDVWMPGGEPAGRLMVTHWSGDFVHWSHERSFSFQRYGYRSLTKDLEEAHSPAGVWNRGNVLLGLYGLWHGSSFLPLTRMDLGVLVSNNGIHFREPIPDFVFLKAGKDNEWDRRGLLHGQGFINVGEKTYIYYGSYDPSTAGDSHGAVGLATLRRDSFGYLSTKNPGEGAFSTIPISMARSGASLYVNAEGLDEDAYLRIELIDKLGREIPGYSGTEAGILKQSGLHERVSWAGKTALTFGQPFRLRLRFMGKSANKIKFYAAYVE